MSKESKKVIKINPELFVVSKDKTRKNTDNKGDKKLKTFVNPNSLKKQLVERIKKHKNKEHDASHSSSNKDKQGGRDRDDDNDEFMDSINYLSSLTKKKKEHDIQIQTQPQPQNQINQQHQRQLQNNNKTMKRPIIESPLLHSQNGNNFLNSSPIVHLDFPDELKEPLIPVKIQTPINSQYNNIQLKIYPKQDVPYGCLKNGVKPTYRTWNATRKNIPSSSIFPTTNNNLSFQQPSQNVFNINTQQQQQSQSLTEREKKLESLKQKIKTQKEIIEHNKIHNVMQTYIQQQQNQTPGPIGGQFGVNIEQQAIKTSNMPSISTQNFQQPASELESLVEEIKNEPPRFIKKTIHRKYTLGKSKINKNVGVLIKDKKTRKNILDAHKECGRRKDW